MNTKDWLLLPLCVLLAALSSALTGLWTSAPHAQERSGAAPAPASEAVRSLEARLDDLRREQTLLREELAQAAAGAPETREAVDGVDGAVARWMERNAPALAAHPDAHGAQDAQPDPADAAAIEAAVDRILGGEDTDLDFWMQLRQSGRLDGVIASLERIAEASPHDPDVQVELAGAYVQKVFDVGPGPLQSKFSDAACQAYDRALDIAPDNWRARFGKALTLSNEPTFLGKTGEAIKNFEVLVEQQEARPPEPRFAQTYFFLGNLYRESGAPEKAAVMWRRGLAIFPDDQRLAGQLAGLEEGGR